MVEQTRYQTAEPCLEERTAMPIAAGSGENRALVINARCGSASRAKWCC
jgi:hypothetical protein